jgi:hypothetical protein
LNEIKKKEGLKQWQIVASANPGVCFFPQNYLNLGSKSFANQQFQIGCPSCILVFPA